MPSFGNYVEKYTLLLQILKSENILCLVKYMENIGQFILKGSGLTHVSSASYSAFSLPSNVIDVI